MVLDYLYNRGINKIFRGIRGALIIESRRIIMNSTKVWSK